MLNLSIDKITEFFEYRQARVEGAPIRLKLTENDYEFLKFKLEKAGFKIDNHIVFAISNGVNTCYVMCSDSTLYIGGSLVRGKW